MNDIWIQEEKKMQLRQLVRDKEHDKQMREKEKIAHITPCDNCGETPAYRMNYNGMYRPDVFPNGFDRNLCRKCKEEFELWYYEGTDLERDEFKHEFITLPSKKKKHWWN